MITYVGKTELKNKINNLIDEMYSDEEYIYQIKIEEYREDERLKGLEIKTTEIRSSMPEF